MSRFESILARLPDGALRELRVEVSEDEPWQLEFRGLDGVVHQYRATDLFRAFRDMREDLERKGLQLLCAGARPDVIPSAMSRSMSGGRKAYVIRQGKQANKADLVDIFDYAELAVVGSVEQQRDYFETWARSLRQQQ
jgi:hypothetical protein